MLDKNTAMQAYRENKCTKLFSYNNDDVAKQGFLPGDWIFKHLKAAADPSKCFLVYDANNIGLFEIAS